MNNMNNQDRSSQWNVKMSKGYRTGQKRVVIEFDMNISRKVSRLEVIFKVFEYINQIVFILVKY